MEIEFFEVVETVEVEKTIPISEEALEETPFQNAVATIAINADRVVLRGAVFSLAKDVYFTVIQEF